MGNSSDRRHIDALIEGMIATKKIVVGLEIACDGMRAAALVPEFREQWRQAELHETEKELRDFQATVNEALRAYQEILREYEPPKEAREKSELN